MLRSPANHAGLRVFEMRCATCDSENPADAKFCERCGAAFAVRCARCGHGNRPGGRFCTECGTPLPRAEAAAEGGAAPSREPPAAYTPAHLASKILASRSAIEGERKQVSVLFADIKGSTELIRTLDTEEAQRLLDGAVAVMMDAVHRFEGTVCHAMGDGIMALFGAPIAHEDHALRACYAALALQEGMRRYADEARRSHGALVEARVGLNSGEVVVRVIRDDLGLDYTAMGQTVHLASRLEQLAREGSCLLSPAVLALVDGYVDVRAMGPVAIKGLGEPLELFELAGANPARNRLQARVARGLTRFVGRQAELAAVFAALDKARAGRGQLVALVGEPGVGKSRLVWEVMRSHRTDEWLKLESGSVSYGKATSWLPVIDILKAYFRIGPRDDARAMREKVVGKLLTLDRALESVVPAFLSLLDVPVDDEAWGALDPLNRRRATLGALKRVLLRESREQPLLLAFEDLHWVDSETQALLDGLVDALPTARILLLVNYRPEYGHAWGSKSCYTQVRIDTFGPESATALLEALIGRTGTPAGTGARGGASPSMAELTRLLIARTDGNPLFLEECVQSLVETGALRGQRGAYELVGGVEAVRVPPTVQAMLAARIDRLPDVEKRLLQTMATIGKDVAVPLLRAVALGPANADRGDRFSEVELESGLVRLQAAEFVYEANLFPVVEYTFKHALTHEVAYGGLLQERRRGLHARIVAAMEATYPDRLGELGERLAHHAMRGEMWARAVVYARQAAMKNVGRSANREALVLFEQALAALAHLPQQRETVEQAIDLRLDMRQALVPLARFDLVLAHLEEAETMAQGLGDQARLARILTWLAYSYYFSLADYDRSIATAERALAAGRAQGDLPVQVLATFYLSFPHQQRGDYRKAVDCLEWIVATLRGEMVRERFGMAAYPAVLARALLAWCLGDLGEFAPGNAHADDALDLAATLDQPWSQAVAQTYLGHFYLGQGKVRVAIGILERCDALARRLDLPRILSFSASLLGAAYAMAGRGAEALPYLDRAATQIEKVEGVSQSRLAIPLAEGYLCAGRLDEATRFAERALEVSRERGERGYAVQALRLQGEIALENGSGADERAQALFSEAHDAAERLGMKPHAARCRLGLGRLHRRAGRHAEARSELVAAIDTLERLDMPHWLPVARAELAALPAGATSAPATAPAIARAIARATAPGEDDVEGLS
jgi:class 3 adenylate cyclase/tetratricopeptide (TPR) repeat protein